MTVRFLKGERGDLWEVGDEAEDVGPESEVRPEMRRLQLASGETVLIDQPYKRGIIEEVGP